MAAAAEEEEVTEMATEATEAAAMAAAAEEEGALKFGPWDVTTASNVRSIGPSVILSTLRNVP